MNSLLQRAAMLLAALLVAPAAHAQSVPPPGNIDQRVRQQVAPLGPEDQANALMTGDTDILLLRRTPLFTLVAAGDLTTTSNAALAPTDEASDSFGQVQIGIGIGTRIAGKVDIFANAALVGVRYFRRTELDYSAAAFNVGARAQLGSWTVGATYQPSLVYSRDFKDRQLVSHRLRLGVARGFAVQGVAVEPELHVERAIAHPSDYSAWSGGGSLTLSKPLTKSRKLIAYAQAGYDRTRFDDYFSAFVGVRRKDDLLSAGAGLVWRPRPMAELRVSYGFGRNWSTSDVNRYKAHSGTAGITATIRF